MPHPGGHRYVEVGALCAGFALLALSVARVVPGLDSWPYTIAVGVGGYIVADMMTGIVHWAGDTVGSSSWPILGKGIIHPFRHHHVDPIDLTRHDFVELNGNNALASLPVLVGAVLLAPYAPYAAMFLTTVVVFAMATNKIHQWAHHPSPPRWVRALQRARLILPPEHHQIHHTFPHDRAYCITTGWMNPVLDTLGVFRAAEWVLERVHPRLISVESAQRRPARPGAARRPA